MTILRIISEPEWARQLSYFSQFHFKLAWSLLNRLDISNTNLLMKNV
ncbi:hypothetical protein GCHA_4691 [Paraglaciecola chathamensis S18K6]|uniref:Uncharacterized protein n=1 Tax=Paraglaciecola chathamensis S18K6 TaxID=1127672 RepID=A0AAV3V6U6_9ALTE|nr:hypothetical protein GCHA_4691 [Paraglaciecola chathamensis S18K6]